jgi:hypothetical protein
MPRRVCLFASEIGTLLGQNRFKSADDAVESVLMRYGVARHGYVKAIAKVDAALEADVVLKQCITTAVPDKATHLRLITEVETIEKARITKTKSDSASEQKAETARIMVAVQSPEVRDFRLRKSQMHYKRQREVDVADIQTVAKRARSAIDCTVGIKEETTVVKAHAIEGTQRAFRKELGIGTTLLYGKVDGYDAKTNQVIEIKIRRSRLYRRLWPQEIVQVFCYMFMSGAKSTRFIERCGDESFETTIEWDEAGWLGYVDELRPICAKLDQRIAKR